MQANPVLTIVLGVALVGACGKKEDPGATAPAGDGTCLVGGWEAIDSGVVRGFTFRADNTGEEVYAPDDIRPLTWSLVDAKTVHVVYPAQGDQRRSEFDLGLDCAKLTFGPAGMYHRK